MRQQARRGQGRCSSLDVPVCEMLTNNSRYPKSEFGLSPGKCTPGLTWHIMRVFIIYKERFGV